MTLTYTLLLLTVLLGFINTHRLVFLISLGATLISGWVEGRLTPLGMGALILLGILIFVHTQKLVKNPFFKLTLWALIAALLGALSLHLIPGFHNLRVAYGIHVSALSSPVTLYLNFDKSMAALLLFGLSPLFRLERPLSPRRIWITLMIFTLCVLVVFIPAYGLGYVAYDPKLPTILGLWAINNFFFVCISEEILFRGFLQTTLKSVLKSPYLALVLSSALFGLAHFKGGMGLMGLATLAGLFYGYTYHRTQSLLAASLVHFGLNLVHFIFFSYPTLLKVH